LKSKQDVFFINPDPSKKSPAIVFIIIDDTTLPIAMCSTYKQRTAAVD
jgi:hypothetical protein